MADVEERLAAVERLREALISAQRRSRALHAAILERAFRGELVPQDPSDEPAETLLARIRAERATEAAARPPKPPPGHRATARMGASIPPSN